MLTEGELRIGLGVDAHALEDGVPLVLGGVRVESARGLAGHSDGDVITHALIDAILGAANMGDIGSLFPSDDGTPPGVSSLVLLEDAYARVRADRWELVNADCVFIGQEPQVAPMRDDMRTALAAALRRPGPRHCSRDDDRRPRFHRARRRARCPGRRIASSGLDRARRIASSSRSSARSSSSGG